MRNGFTLIEMIVVIVIVAVAGIAGVVVLREGVEIYMISSRESGAHAAARLGLDRMTREIRELDRGSVSAATATEISFTNPYNTDLTRGANPVTFRLSGGTLERSGDGGASWEPLVEGVENSGVFTYYRIESGTAAAFTPAAPYGDIEWILVKLEVRDGDRTALLRQQVSVTRSGQ